MLIAAVSQSSKTALIPDAIRISYCQINKIGLTYELYRSKDMTIWTAESNFLEGEETISTLTNILPEGRRQITKIFPAPANDTECFYRLGVQ